MSRIAILAVVPMILASQATSAQSADEWQRRRRDACVRTKLMLEMHYDEEAPGAASYARGMTNRMQMAHGSILNAFVGKLATHPEVRDRMIRYLSDIREVRLAASDAGYATDAERGLIEATAPGTLVQVNRVVGEVNSQPGLFHRDPVPRDFIELRERRTESGFVLAVAVIPENTVSGDGKTDFVRDRIYAEVGAGEIRIRACTQARRDVGTTLFDGCTTQTYRLSASGTLESERSELQSELFEVRGFAIPIPEKAEYVNRHLDYDCERLLAQRAGGLASSEEPNRSPAIDTQSDQGNQSAQGPNGSEAQPEDPAHAHVAE